jgi:hypothetical protein
MFCWKKGKKKVYVVAFFLEIKHQFNIVFVYLLKMLEKKFSESILDKKAKTIHGFIRLWSNNEGKSQVIVIYIYCDIETECFI